MKKDALFLKNFIWNALGIGLNACNSLFCLIVVSRVLGLHDAGIFAIAFATSIVLYTIGLYSGRLFQVTDIEHKVNDKEYILHRVLTCTLMIVISFAFVLIRGYDFYKSSIFVILCLYKALDAFSDILYGVLQKNNELYKSGISLTTKSLLGVGLFLLTNLITKNLVLASCMLVLVNVLVLVSYDLIQAKKYLRTYEHIRITNIPFIFKNEFFVFANSFASMYILNATRYAIDSYLTEEMQAIYGYILMPASVMVLFAQFVLLPFLNKFKELYEQHNIAQLQKTVLQIIAAIAAFAAFAIGLGFLIGPEVLGFIYGVDLGAYRINLVIVLGAFSLSAISYVNLIVLTTIRKTFVQFVIYMITLCIAFVSANYFVRTYQIDGGAYACLTALSLQFIMYAVALFWYLRAMRTQSSTP